ncbi:TRO [Symbiodinium sp. CCMP2592]|nr:TRO [Symbiodinium sp. CCMP2592]
MDFSSLTPASSGQVDILELLWPPAADADAQRVCVAYVLMLRADGFLLTVPGSFFTPAELAADGEEGLPRPGPSLQLEAPAVALSEEGDWIVAPSAEPLSVTVVDFPASLAAQLSPVELDTFLGTFFNETDTGLYPLASDVLRQARAWILAEGAGVSSGYQTAASEPPAAAAEARRLRAKRPTVSLLAQQQAALTEVVARLSDQLAQMQKASQPASPTQVSPLQQPVPSGAEVRQAPLSAQLGATGKPTGAAREAGGLALPPFQSVPKSLAHTLGPPPPARGLTASLRPPEVDQDARLAAAITSGELPAAPPQPDLTSAMMAQSQALLTLVGHLAQGGDPVLDSQVSIAFDLLMAGNSTGAADVLALLAVYLDQLHDPPQAIYSDPVSTPGAGVQPFSPLADQKWVTSALGCLREMDLIASRRAEAKPKPKRPPGLPAPPTGQGTPQEEVALTKKQQRAAQWAAKRAAAGATPPPANDAVSAPTALFPIPSPSAAPVGRSTRQRGGTRQAGRHMSRALHVIIMALNFVHSGFRPVPLSALRRPPNLHHISVFRRVSGYLRACCRRGISIPYCAGRRGSHLAARLGELSDFLLACGVGLDSYDVPAPAAFADKPLVPHAPGGPDCLRPYRPLEADTIVLHGEADWDISPFLSPGMLLAFRDPLVLETFPGSCGPAPSFKHENPEEVFKLMKVWDAKGLLTLRPGIIPDIRCSRVFGSFQSPGKFRQIGDRRGQNGLEARLDGVSHLLPQGFLLTKLHPGALLHECHETMLCAVGVCRH